MRANHVLELQTKLNLRLLFKYCWIHNYNMICKLYPCSQGTQVGLSLALLLFVDVVKSRISEFTATQGDFNLLKDTEDLSPTSLQEPTT